MENPPPPLGALTFLHRQTSCLYINVGLITARSTISFYSFCSDGHFFFVALFLPVTHRLFHVLSSLCVVSTKRHRCLKKAFGRRGKEFGNSLSQHSQRYDSLCFCALTPPCRGDENTRLVWSSSPPSHFWKQKGE